MRLLLIRGVSLLCAALAVLAPTSRPARAADAGQADGMVIGVASPITEGGVAQIKNKIEDAFRNRRHLKTIIFDFNPANGPATTVQPYPCLALADYLSELRSRTRPVAFVHDDVTGHTVLPVLACPTLIMSERGALGDVRGGAGRLSDTVRHAYQKFGKTKTSFPDLILKMLDKDIAIFKSTDAKRKRFLDRTKINENERERFEPMSGLQRGTALFKADDALATGLCNRILNTLEDVARAEGLSEAGLRQGVLPGPKNAWLVELSEDITRAKADSALRKMKNAIGKGGNFFILVLECQGGNPIVAVDFAEDLRKLQKNENVEIVAFIPARDTPLKLEAPTAIALGCTEILIAKDAVLGAFENLKNNDPTGYKMMRDSLVDLAAAQKYSTLLIQGTLDPDLVIYQVRGKTDPNFHFLLAEKDFLADQQSKKPRWDFEKNVKQKGDLLKLTGALAFQYGLARQTVEDVDGVSRYYGLDRLQKTSSDILDQIQTFFQLPTVRLMLVLIGIIGLILEMKMPGVGLPGVVAAICFVLFFWANSNVGSFTWLAILLFALGLILIGLEVFVLPGMAVFGISGVVLVVCSLVLVTLESAPSTTQEWFSLGMTLTTYTFTLIGAIVAAFLIARFLPQIPYANRLVLTPPSERPESLDADGAAAAAEASAALLGAIGEAATTLRPAGKARFGEQYLDVVAEGSFVNAGKRVQVIEIEGNRVVVKEV